MLFTDISQGIVEDGIITFPFKVKLPEKNAPSSFESKFGAVRYWFKTSLLPDNFNCQHPFTVLEKINVNNNKYQVSSRFLSKNQFIKYIFFRAVFSTK